jgi:hypothetical protein
MNTSQYGLFRILKKMDDIRERKKIISYDKLVKFCEQYLLTIENSIIFTGMYDGCWNFKTNTSYKNYRYNFYSLSRYIDDEIMKKKDVESIFNLYDKKMEYILNLTIIENKILYDKFNELREKYLKEDDIFNFDSLQKPDSGIKVKQIVKYKFDPTNLLTA